MVLSAVVLTRGRAALATTLLVVSAGLSLRALATCEGSCFSTAGLQEGATCAAETATCGGQSWEKLTCHNPTTCLDHYGMCKSWDVCSCCSAEPLYKCLLPTAAKAFAPECSSPIDARQQCCGDAVTHERTTDVEEAIKAAATEAKEKAKEAYDATEQFIEENHDACADPKLLSPAAAAKCAEKSDADRRQ